MKNHSYQRHFTALLLALAIVLSLLPSGVFAAWGILDGSGTADSPYLIEDAADLTAFRDKVNSGERAICAELTADIDLGGAEWTPIGGNDGYATSFYGGIFDGGGHTVSNFKITNAGYNNAGFFSCLKDDVRVSGLKIADAQISSGKNNVGGIAGTMISGTIENCSFSGSVTNTKTSSGYAGGIAGYIGNTNQTQPVVKNCVNTGAVSAPYAGGVSGYAKYAAMISCYNTGTITGTTRSGGIAGQLQNNCTAANCYNLGKISGSATAADICDFLYTSATLRNCFYTEKASGAGSGTIESSCGIIDESLLTNLGSAFVADAFGVNNGYPILSWQAGSALIPKDPHITISGNSLLVMTNSGATPQTTLSVEYIDMDEQPEITWSVSQGDGIVTLETPENTDASNRSIIVKAVGPGIASVTATAADGKTAEIQVSVMPFLTTLGINGTTAAGQTVYARVNTLGGAEYDYENYPNLQIQWKYLTAEDYECGNTGSSSYKDITGANSRTFTIPDELAGCYLSFSVLFEGEYKTPSRPQKILSAAEGVVADDAKNLTLDTSDVKESKTLVLPSQGAKGSTITWKSSDSGIIDPKSGLVTLPASGIEDVTLTASLTYGGVVKTSTFQIKVYSSAAIEEEKANKKLRLEKAAASLGSFYTMYPVYGTDTNVVDVLKAALKEKEYTDVSVTLKNVTEVYGGAGISDDGTITYFYTDPNTAPAIRMGRCDAVFTLALDGAELDVQYPVIIYWDADKVKDAMRREILDHVTLAPDAPLTENLSLPKVIDGKMWTQISWSSSNENVLSISSEKQQTADTLFDPYIGVVRRGAADETVTLTATFAFMLTNDVTGSETPITLNKVFDVTVKALGEQQADEIRRQLEETLNNGFASAGLTDAVTKKTLTANENGIYTAENDVLFPTTRDFGIDGKYYPVQLVSNAESIKTPDAKNAARAEIFRPAPGEPDAAATVTISITDKNTSISASKAFNFIIPALTQEEIEAEIALMERVKAAYFDGIRGKNAAANNIKTDLSPFLEVYEEDGALVWVRDSKRMANHGIIPVAMDGWEELEAWRLFRSSNPAVITHENLLVTLQRNAKAVTISSALSSETLGKYGALYQQDPIAYACYAPLAGLHYQEVSAELAVRGTTTTANALPVPVAETIDVTFRLQSSNRTLIQDITYQDLDETTTVYDIFKRALEENGYTYKSRGSYVYSITAPDGTTLEEMDEGKNSGWMYKVNGSIPDVYMGAYGLSDGDKITVFFTKDYTEESDFPARRPASSSSDKKTSDNAAPMITPTMPFTDISGHWAESAILNAHSLGLMNGVGGNEFSPDAPLTRAMFVTILYRLEKEPEAGRATFIDVASGSWYQKAVGWAYENGIVTGVSESKFAPEDEITREQLAAILYRYAAFKGYDLTTADNINYTDQDSISGYASTAVLWTLEHSIMNGNGDGTFAPQNSTTRAQAAAVLFRINDNLK